jgi:hypothetical protein
MTAIDPNFEGKARRTIQEQLVRGRLRAGRKLVYLVSYPRSGNTLVREYFALLQGRTQLSVYADDVVHGSGPALTRALDRIGIVKSHQMPADGNAMIYLVRDGRNATLSFLYMSFLLGNHRFSAPDEVCDGIRHLDAAEGSWADHVAQALQRGQTRPTLFVRYEDLVSAPEAALAQMALFLGAEVAPESFLECVRRQRASSNYAANPHNGYLYQPPKNSIYDVLKRHRREDYWRHILDARSKRYFHECGGTRFLLHFGYERSEDWWKE